MEYTELGICIWCKKSKPDCTFKEKPHTVPKSLGGKNIGFDICDECNHYFGQPDLLSIPNIAVETSFKEIFGIIRHLLESSRAMNNIPNNQLKSIYFEYWHSKKKIVIKKSFQFNYTFLKTFTRQFKRSLYEIFLQEYHYKTKNGLDNRFNIVRDFARYNKGDLPVYHIINNGIILVPDNMSTPEFVFNEIQINQIDEFGYYELWLNGYIFLLEVTPRCILTRNSYLSQKIKEYNIGGFVNKSLIELKSINEIDFTLRSLLGNKS